MKKITILTLLFLLISLTTVSSAEDQSLYLRENIEVALTISSQLEAHPKTDKFFIDYIKARLLLHPIETDNQKVLLLKTSPTTNIENNSALFEWKDTKQTEFNYSLTTWLYITQKKPAIKEKIDFPFTVPKELLIYTRPSEHIDSDNALIREQASRLAEGQDDAFELLFTLARWVEQNVQYNLSTLTEDVAQNASWVLFNRIGVCDEMTSIFIAFARSLGMPARFVSGVAYTTSPYFSQPWVSHGWAEVYLPTVGWVPFDIAFGEFGYIDATHITLQQGRDPADPATHFEWLGNVNLEAKNLDMDVAVRNTAPITHQLITFTSMPVHPSVNFGSNNIIHTEIKNSRNEYSSSTFTVSGPRELSIEKKKTHVLLEPNEKKDIYWIVHVPENLDKRYRYTFPLIIWNEQNISSEVQFVADDGAPIIPPAEVEQFRRADQVKKNVSEKVDLDCTAQQNVHTNEPLPVTCRLKNKGTTTIRNLAFCIDQVCSHFDLLIAQEQTTKNNIQTKKPGQFSANITLTGKGIEKNTPMTYEVLDDPSITIKELSAPSQIDFDQNATITLILEKSSYSTPKNIKIKFSSGYSTKEISVENIDQEEKIEFTLSGSELNEGENILKFTILWETPKNETLSITQDATITMKFTSVWQRLESVFLKIKQLLIKSLKIQKNL